MYRRGPGCPRRASSNRQTTHSGHAGRADQALHRAGAQPEPAGRRLKRSLATTTQPKAVPFGFFVPGEILNFLTLWPPASLANFLTNLLANAGPAPQAKPQAKYQPTSRPGARPHAWLSAPADSSSISRINCRASGPGCSSSGVFSCKHYKKTIFLQKSEFNKKTFFYEENQKLFAGRKQP